MLHAWRQVHSFLLHHRAGPTIHPPFSFFIIYSEPLTSSSAFARPTAWFWLKLELGVKLYRRSCMRPVSMNVGWCPAFGLCARLKIFCPWYDWSLGPYRQLEEESFYLRRCWRCLASSEANSSAYLRFGACTCFCILHRGPCSIKGIVAEWCVSVSANRRSLLSQKNSLGAGLCCTCRRRVISISVLVCSWR